MATHKSFDSLADAFALHSFNLERNATREVRATALQALATLIPATPVDTGRARSNYFVSVGSPSTEVIDAKEEAKKPKDSRGISALQREQGHVSKYTKSDQVLYITNNLSYIRKLNSGSSQQAPKAFIEKAVQQAQNSIRGATFVGVS